MSYCQPYRTEYMLLSIHNCFALQNLLGNIIEGLFVGLHFNANINQAFHDFVELGQILFSVNEKWTQNE